MHYSENPGNVRIDIFKEHGKWYTTEVIKMNNYYEQLTVKAVISACLDKFYDPKTKKLLFKDMWVVCLEPYCKYEFPVMFKLSMELVK